MAIVKKVIKGRFIKIVSIGILFKQNQENIINFYIISIADRRGVARSKSFEVGQIKENIIKVCVVLNDIFNVANSGFSVNVFTRIFLRKSKQ